MSSLEQQYEYIPVEELEPHPLNKRIYTNEDIGELKGKIAEHGFHSEHNLIVTPENQILSGHRRWRAAKELEIEQLPVVRVEPDGENDELRRLLLANQYRDKTPAEKIREGKAWEQVEREAAKERKTKAGESNLPTTESTSRGNSTTSKGKTRDKVGEKIGVSGRTYERGKEVKEKAEDGDEVAQEQWEKLERGEQSISGAHREVKSSEVKQKRGDSTSKTEDNGSNEKDWRDGTVSKRRIEYAANDGHYDVRIGDETYEVKRPLLKALLKESP